MSAWGVYGRRGLLLALVCNKEGEIIEKSQPVRLESRGLDWTHVSGETCCYVLAVREWVCVCVRTSCVCVVSRPFGSCVVWWGFLFLNLALKKLRCIHLFFISFRWACVIKSFIWLVYSCVHYRRLNYQGYSRNFFLNNFLYLSHSPGAVPFLFFFTCSSSLTIGWRGIN
jgi:hypothetical protein